MTTVSPSTSPWPLPISALAFRHGYGVSGWAALLAPGALAGAGVALIAGRPGVRRLAAGVAGGLLCGAVLARVADEVQWRRSAVSLRVDEPDAALDLMQAVRAEGVRAEMVRAVEPTGPNRGSFALRYRAKDDRRVRALLAEQQL